MRRGLYAALIALNLEPADLDNQLPRATATDIKPRIAEKLPKLCDRVSIGNGPNIARSVGQQGVAASCEAGAKATP